MYDDGRRGPAGHRRGQGPRGAAPPGRHPRRRGGDHQGAAHRVPARSSASPRRPATPSDAPIVTQYEMHGVEELGLLKMDFLGPAQPLGHRADPRPHRGRHRRAGPTSTPSRSTTPQTFAMLRRGDSIGVFQLEGGPMRSLMRSLAPDLLRRRRRPRGPLPARADGGEHAPRLRRPQERPQAGHLPPPRPRADPGRHLRADDLPGVGDAGGPAVRRLHPRARPTTCARRAARRSAR